MFGAAVFVLLDEFLGSGHNGESGAVVLLQIEYLCTGIDGFKLGESLRVGGPKTVDALVLVAHQKEVAVLSRQQSENRVLDFGGVLGLVHTEVGVAAAELLQKLRELAQNPVGIDHLVVVVHELVGAQQAAVLLVDGRKLHPFHLYLFQVLARDHAVFYIGDGGLHRLDGAL